MFSKPEFIFENDIPDFTWAGHTFFAYDVIKNFKPEVIAELGSYKGTSSLSFMQAVKDSHLNTNMYFVDSWEGEEQTGFYEDDVYTIFTSLTNKYFKDLNVHALKMYFDDALKQFKDKSIDVLHIDGLHTYEAVKHDYDTWAPKVKYTGVILFHDVKVQNFGVKDLWAEIKKANPNATFFEFDHNYGLGVMLKDPSLKSVFTPEKIKEIKEYYFKISAEYRYRQRVVELEHENIDLDNGFKNLDKMLKEVMAENTELYQKLDYQKQEFEKELNRQSVKAALKVGNTLRIIKKRFKQ